MSEHHRNEGIRLLQKAGGAMHPGTDLATAAEHLYKAHAETTDAFDKATDIAHCGICFWFAALAFFRLGAKTNIGSCKSGAPEELFLTMTLKPNLYPGGVIGSRLRLAVSPNSVTQLIRCLEAAQFCFTRATELGQPGTGILWQVALYRGTGSFTECTQAASDARSKVSANDCKDIDSYASGVPGYQSDFKWLVNQPCTSIVTPDKWIHPEILDSMSRVCDLLEGDTTFASTQSGTARNPLGSATDAVEANKQQRKTDEEQDRVARAEAERKEQLAREEAHRRFVAEEAARQEDERKSTMKAQRRETKLCELCGKPLGFFARLFSKTSHSECREFKE